MRIPVVPIMQIVVLLYEQGSCANNNNIIPDRPASSEITDPPLKWFVFLVVLSSSTQNCTT